MSTKIGKLIKVTLAGALFSVFVVQVACSKGQQGVVSGEPPPVVSTSVPHPVIPGIRASNDYASFLTATTGINPATDTGAKDFYNGVKAQLSNGFNSSVRTVQAAMDLALTVCKQARIAEESGARPERLLFIGVNFSKLPAQIDPRVVTAVTRNLLVRFNGNVPSQDEIATANQVLIDLLIASPATSDGTRGAFEGFCAAVASSAAGTSRI